MAAGSTSSEIVDRSLVQDGRLLQITTTLPDGTLALEVFTGTEEVSKPFEFHLRLLSYKPDIDCASLLKTSVTVNVALDNTESPEYRSFNGIFSRFSSGQSTSQEFYLYEATMVPSVWLLSLTRDSKIFQNKTVPQIVQQVLSDAGISNVSMNTQATYQQREYCVQYRESALDFISRLLEEEGIYYYFAHEKSKHTITFADNSKSAAASLGTFAYSDSEKGGPSGGGIYSLTRLYEPCSNKVVLQDYDFTAPAQTQKADSAALVSYASGEFFDYPGDDGNQKATLSSTSYAKVRMEEFEAFTCTIEGMSEYVPFQPGSNITVEKHPLDDINADYFVVSVTHDATETTHRTSDNQGASYSNRYRAIPKDTVYRPPRVTAKPVLTGPQTAVVVGPSGEEIYTDQYGRVKVQFFWDRVGGKDENSSCWVRVSQIWSGKNWGWVTIPRIGQEVVVSFLEGDPDHPIIIGRVYNADQTVPYALPDNKTQSGIKTRSSPQGGSENYNELWFEDKKGEEKITFHAEKDMETFVENNDTQTVKVDRTITVEGKHTETITKDTSITITEGNHSLDVQTGNHTIKVDQGNHSMTVSMGNHSVEVDLGNQSVKVNAGSQSTFVMQGITHESVESITLTVGASSIQITPTNINLSAPMINISAEGIGALSGAVVQIEGDITLIN